MESTKGAAPTLVQRLKAAEDLATLILDEIEIHADARYLGRILRHGGSSPQAVVKNWAFEQLDRDHLRSNNLNEARRELVSRLQAILLEECPEACNFS